MEAAGPLTRGQVEGLRATTPSRPPAATAVEPPVVMA